MTFAIHHPGFQPPPRSVSLLETVVTVEDAEGVDVRVLFDVIVPHMLLLALLPAHVAVGITAPFLSVIPGQECSSVPSFPITAMANIPPPPQRPPHTPPFAREMLATLGSYLRGCWNEMLW
jgi:hypothetical protein